MIISKTKDIYFGCIQPFFLSCLNVVRDSPALQLTTPVLIFLVASLVSLNLPGLYMDAVNPDYLAVDGEWVGSNSVWTLPHDFFPVLGNWYHGVMTYYFGWPVYEVLGANIFSIRIFTTLVGATIVVLSYFVLRNMLGKKSMFPFVGAILLATSPQLILSLRSQYYIILFGVIPLLGAVLVFFHYLKKYELWKLLLSGLLLGLAFYNYFIFILFVVPFVASLVIKKKYKDLVIFLGSVGIGSVLYVWGYLMITMELTGLGKHRALIYSFFILLLILFIASLVCALKKRSSDMAFRVVGTAIVLAGLIGLIVLSVQPLRNDIRTVANYASKASTPMSGGMSATDRADFTYRMTKGVITGSELQSLILHERFDGKIENIRLALVAVSVSVVAIASGFFVVSKKRLKHELGFKSLFILGLCGGFLVLATATFSGRLGAHHFSSLLAFLYILVAVSLSFVWNLRYKTRIFSYVAKALVVFILATLLMANYLTYARVMIRLEETGGRGYFSSQINVLAQNALEGSRDTVYVFKDWGFFMPFKFLTSDSVEYYNDVSPELLDAVQSRSLSIRVCYWKTDDTDAYLSMFKNSGWQSADLEIYKGRDAVEAFYCVYAKP